jgi:hypothetical protein
MTFEPGHGLFQRVLQSFGMCQACPSALQHRVKSPLAYYR